MRRLMIYSQDGGGLGHMRRAWNIAREVLAREPGGAVLIVCDSPATPLFAPLPGMDYLKLPSIEKCGPASWRTHSLSLDIDDTMRLRTRLILEAFAAFRPDTVLVDCLPVGALRELVPLLEGANRRSRPRLFLGLRDVLGEPDLVHAGWTELGAHEYIPCYDAVLVYGCDDVFDTASVYGVNASARRIVSCNYVVSPPAPAVRRATDAEDVVLFMAGGGGDGFPVAAAFLEAMPLVQRNAAVRPVILPGPNMPLAERQVLAAKAADVGAEMPDGHQDALPWVARADAVVTMAGYNSLCESLRECKKVLAVPRATRSGEQRIRARVFAERRLIAEHSPHDLAPDRLGEDLLRLLGDDRLPSRSALPAMDGAQRAAETVLAA
jgi:predicted glycosyltransferase